VSNVSAVSWQVQVNFWRDDDDDDDDDDVDVCFALDQHVCFVLNQYAELDFFVLPHWNKFYR